MLKKAAQAAQRVLKGLFRAEDQEGVATTPGEDATFVLLLATLLVGELLLRHGKWEFSYSPEFRDQLSHAEAVQPLIDFPDPGRVYESEELWPFFLARIPSLSQPRVREEIERRGLDKSSASQLLRAFGERTIANPFILRAA